MHTYKKNEDKILSCFCLNEASEIMAISCHGFRVFMYLIFSILFIPVEIFMSNNAVWTSPSGQYLVYATFNDSRVGEASYTWYADDLPYPKLRTLKYPKVGIF